MRLATLTLGLLLGGCANTLVTTAQMNERIGQAYWGRPVEGFFRTYGLPAAAMRLQSGNTLYEWRSDVHTVQMPSIATFDASVSGSRMSGSAMSVSGGGMSLRCVVQIEADEQGMVKNTRIAADTLGAWTLSRCAEVLSL